MAEKISKIAVNYAHDYRDMAMSEDVLRRMLAAFYQEILPILDAQEGKEPVEKPLEDHAFVGDTQEPLCMECDEPLSSHKAQEKPVGCGRGYALPYPSTGWAVCNENQQCQKCTQPPQHIEVEWKDSCRDAGKVGHSTCPPVTLATLNANLITLGKLIERWINTHQT